MKKTIMMSIAFGIAGLAGMSQLAQADGCSSEDQKIAAMQMKKADDYERAGKLQEAYETAGKVDGMCLPGDGDRRQNDMRKRIGQQLGRQEEKQGRLDKAFDWYKDAHDDADADRIKMKQVSTSSHDRNVVSGAIDYFKSRNNNSRVSELRQLAAQNADLELSGEEKAFAARKESFDELGRARDWLYLVSDSAVKKALDRALQRGDTLAKEDIYRHLENAKHYFSIADAKQKIKSLQEKALKLAQQHEKKGEISQARDFYGLAGASDKGNSLEERAEAQHKKSEEKRKKQFNKGQDDLEKELGM